MSLTPEQRDALRDLLAEELRTAWRAAVEQGACPDTLATRVEQQRRRLAGHSAPAGDDPDGTGGEPVDGDGVGEQR